MEIQMEIQKKVKNFFLTNSYKNYKRRIFFKKPCGEKKEVILKIEKKTGKEGYYKKVKKSR
jgi:hypothetical protein